MQAVEMPIDVQRCWPNDSCLVSAIAPSLPPPS